MKKHGYLFIYTVLMFNILFLVVNIAAWNITGDSSNFVYSKSPNESTDYIRFGVYYDTHDENKSIEEEDLQYTTADNVPENIELAFYGNNEEQAIKNFAVNLVFKTWAAPSTIAANSSEKLAFRYSKALELGSDGGSWIISKDQSNRWSTVYTRTSEAAYSYLRLIGDGTNNNNDGCSYLTFDGNLVTAISNTGVTNYTIKGISTDSSVANGSIGNKNIITVASGKPIKIGIYLPYILNFKGFSGRYGINLFGFSAPTNINIHFYKVSSTIYEGILNEISNKTADQLALNEIAGTMQTINSSEVIGNFIVKYENTNLEVFKTNTDSATDDKFVYTIEYVWNDGANTKSTLAKPIYYSGSQTTEERTILQTVILYSPNQNISN